MKASDLFIEALEAEGVEYIFGITVTDGRIQEVKFGARSESWLRARLEPET